MPIYEFSCKRCSKVFSFLVGVGSDSGDPACPQCGSTKLSKLISRIARIRSKVNVMDDLADFDKVGNLEDPKAMAQWAKKMGQAIGEETGEDLDEKVEEILENPSGEDDFDTEE
jgi:putative FmdB family regulatory protein